MNDCPVCEATATMIRFEPALDMNGNVVDIFQCRQCMALTNGRAYERLADQAIADIQLTDYYLSDDLSYDQAKAMVRDKGSILNYLYGKLDVPFHDMTFCDFGGGAGAVAIAAAERFRASYICEFDTRSVQQMCDVIGKPANMGIVQSLDEIPQTIDVFFMWHVLEHIPRTREFITSIRHRLSPNCIFFLQCPGYRPEAIVDCHYVFFNEPSIRFALSAVGVEEIEIGFDVNLGFVGYLGRLRN